MDQKLIRNFAIIAHIDHGKSTLADRLMEMTGTVDKRHEQAQLLDSHPISRERGITIRLAPVTMTYEVNLNSYCLNLIDTPGHVDFSYEVERSLAACEGAILLVDATQGIQAQTLSHFYKAKKLRLKIIPVINKIDAPNAKTVEVEDELIKLLGANSDEKPNISRVSAKTGQGVKELLERIVSEIPAPNGSPDAPTRALVFSSQFDPQRGVVAFVRIVDGQIKTNDTIRFIATTSQGLALRVGHFTPVMVASDALFSGEVGYITTNVKNSELVKVGDTITTGLFPGPIISLPGYREPKPMVFVSLFPVDQNDYYALEDGLKKLKLNDAAITFGVTSSKALGRGFRCGFLGHLHAEVSQERLENDFGLSIIATTPTVEYKIQNSKHEEPWVTATIIVPQDYVGAVMNLCEEKRGVLINMEYLGTGVTLVYELPLAEIITDFFDKLKSQSSGYASVDYEFLEYRTFDAVTLDVLINHEAIDAFSQMMEKSKAMTFGKFLVERLKEIIPRQQIPIPIQASIDGQVIARADIPAYRKDVGAKLYGGDFTRRLKLEQKQKKGKEKMKAIGKVSIPGDTFLKIFKT